MRNNHIVKPFSKKQLKLITELKRYESIEIKEMADTRNKTLSRLCADSVCRYEIVEYLNQENRPRNKIVYTLI